MSSNISAPNLGTRKTSINCLIRIELGAELGPGDKVGDGTGSTGATVSIGPAGAGVGAGIGAAVGVPPWVGCKTGAAVGTCKGSGRDLKLGQSQLSRVNGRTIAAIAKAATSKIPMTMHLCLPCETLGSSIGPSSTPSSTSSLIILLEMYLSVVLSLRDGKLLLGLRSASFVLSEDQCPNYVQISRFGDFSSNKFRFFVSQSTRSFMSTYVFLSALST